MVKELYTAALGMLPQQTRLELTANNIANANTTGYKRTGVFEQSLIDARENLHYIKGSAEQRDAPLQQYTDFSMGELQKTDNPLDIALDQDGFFVLEDSDGNQTFTRGGHFTIDEEGHIANAAGKYLVSEKGIIKIDSLFGDGGRDAALKVADIKVNPSGELFANNQLVARLQVVQVANPQTMEHASGMEFSPTDETQYSPMAAESIRVKQGYLEGSNVNIIGEMVTMIQLQRSFELGQRVITTNDSTIERAIEIGRYVG